MGAVHEGDLIKIKKQSSFNNRLLYRIKKVRQLLLLKWVEDECDSDEFDEGFKPKND